jgi:predicted MFS family arabinose efflux permease
MLGHWRPIFLRFAKGGKMVATCGGALFGLAPYAPFIADAASYPVSFGSIAALRTSLAAPPAERRHLRAEVLEGLRFVWRVPFLRASILQATGTNLTWAAMALTMIFIARAHGASGAAIGGMFALLGVGGILGSLASRRLLVRFSLPAIVLGTIWIWAALIALMLTTTNAFALGAIAGAAMFFAPTWNGAVVGKTMALTPDPLRGRVSAADALLSFGLRPLAFLGAGWLDEAHGGRVTLAVGAAYTLGIAVLSTLSPSLRVEPA